MSQTSDLSRRYFHVDNYYFNNKANELFSLLLLTCHIKRKPLNWYDTAESSNSIKTIIQWFNYNRGNILAKELLNKECEITYSDLLSFSNGVHSDFFLNNKALYTDDTIWDYIEGKIEEIQINEKYLAAKKIFLSFKSFKGRRCKVLYDLSNLLQLYAQRISLDKLESLYDNGEIIIHSRYESSDIVERAPFLSHSYIISDHNVMELIVSPTDSDSYINSMVRSKDYINVNGLEYSPQVSKRSHLKCSFYDDNYPIEKLKHICKKYNSLYTLPSSYKDPILDSFYEEVELFEKNNYRYGYHYNCNVFVYNILRNAIQKQQQNIISNKYIMNNKVIDYLNLKG